MKIQFLLSFVIFIMLSACKTDNPDNDDDSNISRYEGDTEVNIDELNINPSGIPDLSDQGNMPDLNSEPDIPSASSMNTTNLNEPTSGESVVTTAGVVTVEELNQLQASMQIEPAIAYIGQPVTFKNRTPSVDNDLWSWAWNFGRSWLSDETSPSYTFSSMGKQEVQLKAQAGDKFVIKKHQILVTVSQDSLNEVLKTCIEGSKKADNLATDAAYADLDTKLERLKKYLSRSVKIKIPGESGRLNFEDFSDVIIADLPIQDIFSKVSNYDYDKTTGKVTQMTLR